MSGHIDGIGETHSKKIVGSDFDMNANNKQMRKKPFENLPGLLSGLVPCPNNVQPSGTRM